MKEETSPLFRNKKGSIAKRRGGPISPSRKVLNALHLNNSTESASPPSINPFSEHVPTIDQDIKMEENQQIFADGGTFSKGLMAAEMVSEVQIRLSSRPIEKEQEELQVDENAQEEAGDTESD